MNEVRYDALGAVALHVTIKDGASIGEAMRDAIRIASTEWRNVTLEVNGQEFRVLVNDLLAAVRLPKEPVPREDPAPAPSDAEVLKVRIHELEGYLREILSWRTLQGTMSDEAWNPRQELRRMAAEAVGMHSTGGTSTWDAK